MKDKLQLIATKDFEKHVDMYKIIDFLNKNLGDLDLIFGMCEKNGKYMMSIYKEEK
jgi:hypothetical protein